MRDRLLSLASSALADALGRRGAVDSSIRLLSGERLAGRAVTARCAPRSVTAMLDALRTAGEGDVLCVEAGGERAYFGEVAGAEAVRRGVAGVVVDGLVRDLAGLRELGLTVYARGTIPVGGSLNEGGEAGVPIEVGGQSVHPGDWLLGDPDGVVVIGAGEADAAAAAAEAATAAEVVTLRRIAQGESLFQHR
jgi:regulator of RNase E activity RraA